MDLLSTFIPFVSSTKAADSYHPPGDIGAPEYAVIVNCGTDEPSPSTAEISTPCPLLISNVVRLSSAWTFLRLRLACFRFISRRLYISHPW